MPTTAFAVVEVDAFIGGDYDISVKRLFDAGHVIRYELGVAVIVHDAARVFHNAQAGFGAYPDPAVVGGVN